MTKEPEIIKHPVRILVVEDHQVVREGFVALINRETHLSVCAEAAGAAEALDKISRHTPDLVIADLLLSEGDGIELLKSARAAHPELPFLIISMQDEEVYAERCLKSGASGYIMKHSATDEFLEAIQTIMKGDIYLSKRMNARLLQRVARGGSEGRTGLDALTDRELQVYQLIGAGMNPREIAPRLGISPKTVATHRENIKIKLGMKDGRALLQSAMSNL
jgi:DNA-binding NarL/FixJ family response regulator